MAGDGVASKAAPNDGIQLSALEDVVLDSSRTLMSAQPDEFETKLTWTLGSVGEAFGADRCSAYLLERESNTPALSLTHEWTADDLESHTEAARSLDEETYPWLFERLRSFQNAEATPVVDLPEAATATRELLQDEDVESAVVLPLVSDWTLLGAVSFEAIGPRISFTDRRVNLARTFSDMVGHALAQTRRERELRQKNERLEQFASVVSHDLRNPLNVTQASIKLARNREDPDHLVRAEEAANRMERIIEQVLTLARLGRDIGETESVPVAMVAEEAWNAVHTADATIDAADVGDVRADPDRLREALENVYRNAIEHGGEDVDIRVGPLDDASGFYVADDGRGIPEDERETVLEHGYSTAEEGTGLGLSIVTRIVDAHGWEINVTESASGGARFEIITSPAGDRVNR